MVSDDDVSCVEPVHLVRKHKGALWICVVGHNKAFGLVRVRLLQIDHRRSLNKFKELRRFATWCGAHVQDSVVCLHIKQNGRYHAHNLLARNQACVRHVHHQLVDLLEANVLLQQLSRYHHLKEAFMWVEWFEVHLQLAVI